MTASGLCRGIFAASLMASAAHAADRTETISVGGYDRTYIYHLPESGDGRLPVVLVLPEAGVDGASALKDYRWSALADKQGFIAVGLDALPVDPARTELFQTNPYFWSDGSGRGNAKRGHLDDTAYVRAVLDDLSEHMKVDAKRVYAVGFGNGASMASELGQRLPNRLAAIALIAGHAWSPDAPTRPLSVLLLHGASDPVDPIQGGLGVNVWTHGYDQRPAARKTADIWAAALQCKGDPVKSAAGDLDLLDWQGCAGGVALDYAIIPAEGHHWPGGIDDQLSSLGPNGDFDATGYIWNWFPETFSELIFASPSWERPTGRAGRVRVHAIQAGNNPLP